jgi:molybdate transport system regulatory protein
MGNGSDTEGARHHVRGGGRLHHRTPEDAGSGVPPKPAPTVHLAHRLWLERDGDLVFGPGAFELLRRVEQMGSLNKAAKSMAMSYSKAWRVVSEVEERLGVSLFDRRIGGPGGGGSSLTDEARSLLERFGAVAAGADDVLAGLFFEHFRGVSYGPKEPPHPRRGG